MMDMLSILAGAALVCVPQAAPARADSTFRQLFEGGQTFAQFLAKAERRKEQWERNFRDAVVPDALLARARAVPGEWKLLVVAADGCSDSVNTIPYLARLTEQLTGVELRVISSDAGKAIMDSHKTPDGRGATPTVLLLDPNYEERGCWVERPAELQRWIMDNRGKMKDDDIFDRKMKWYEEDKGAKTIGDFVAVMEKAASGSPAC
jgi:hypothetical protein